MKTFISKHSPAIKFKSSESRFSIFLKSVKYTVVLSLIAFLSFAAYATFDSAGGWIWDNAESITAAKLNQLLPKSGGTVSGVLQVNNVIKVCDTGGANCKSIVPSNAQSATMQHHFLLTRNTYDGNLGGLAGADEKCLNEVNSEAWKGKDITRNYAAEEVKAWVCTGTTCGNLQPSSTYTYGRLGDNTVGGAIFTTDVGSTADVGTTIWNPNNSVFGTVSTYAWTNRGYSGTKYMMATPNAAFNHCNSWTSTSDSGYYG